MSRREELEARGVVGGGLGVGDLIRRIVGENHAEVVGLHFAVGGTGFACRLAGDFREELAVRAPWGDVDQKLVLGGFVAHPGERFTILRGGLAAAGMNTGRISSRRSA